MESVEWVYLATIDNEGFPQVRAMANLRNKEQCPGLVKLFEKHSEDFLMYFATGAKSAKMSHIKANPAGSVYFCDAGQRHVLLLVGKLDVVADAELKKTLWQERWIKHFPGGSDDPEYAVLSFVPVFVKGWSLQGPFEFRL
jgi:general stress protein 26